MDGGVNLALLVFFVLLLALGCYALWDSEQVYQKASESYTQYRPDNKENLSFNELVAINPEVFGWLNVYGTPIDYPLVQGQNNEKYINTTAKGEFALSGAIFLDYRNARDFSDFNSIVFGHHMDKNAMFGDLTHFNDQSYFDARQYGTINYGGVDHGIEIFAFLKADAYDAELYTPGLEIEFDRKNYLDHLRELAVHWREVGVSTSDHIVLMSTCTSASTNGRELLAARITDEIHPNPFGEPSENTEHTPGFWDHLKDFFARFNAWPFVLPVLMILPAAILKIRRRRQHRKQG